MIKQINKLSNTELNTLIDLWLDINIETHTYIDKNYWKSNQDFVKRELVKADIFVYCSEKNIVAFLGLVDNYIAGIFISKQFRNNGIGKQLLNVAKEKNEKLILTVYKKNINAIDFYSSQKFKIVKEQVDINTSEIEYVMVWEK